MAKAGSCKMGLKPNPLGWDGIILSKGFDAVKMKTQSFGNKDGVCAII